MPDIVRNILLFLTSNGYAPIPGFGRFSSKYIPSEINQKEEIIYPPRHKISFEFDMLEDSKDFAIWFSENKSIGLIEALEEIQNFKKKILDGLSYNQNFKIENFGLFEFKGDQLYFFEELNKDLPVLSIVPVPRLKAEEQPAQNYKNKKNRSYFFILPIIFISILSFFIVLPFIKKGKSPEIIKISDTLIDEKINKPDSTLRDTVVTNNIRITDTTYQRQDEEKKIKYLIIVGTFSDENNTLRAARKLKSLGYEADIKTYNNGKKRVAAIVNVSNRDELKVHLESIQQKVEKAAFISN